MCGRDDCHFSTTDLYSFLEKSCENIVLTYGLTHTKNQVSMLNIEANMLTSRKIVILV